MPLCLLDKKKRISNEQLTICFGNLKYCLCFKGLSLAHFSGGVRAPPTPSACWGPYSTFSVITNFLQCEKKKIKIKKGSWHLNCKEAVIITGCVASWGSFIHVFYLLFVLDVS